MKLVSLTLENLKPFTPTYVWLHTNIQEHFVGVAYNFELISTTMNLTLLLIQVDRLNNEQRTWYRVGQVKKQIDLSFPFCTVNEKLSTEGRLQIQSSNRETVILTKNLEEIEKIKKLMLIE